MHRFNYRTGLGGFVCTCQRYFDTRQELAEHIKECGVWVCNKLKGLK